MTLNIWNYTRPWVPRRQQIAALIETHQPDVVALQETRHDWRFERGVGQGDQLARMTGYCPSFAVGQVYLPVLRIDEGLTVLTRQEPAHVTVQRLTRHRRELHDQNQRICLGVSLDYAGAQVHIFDTHFSLSPVARITNAIEVARFVRDRSGDQPAVLMGDLNAEPDTPPMRFLLGKETIDGESADFVDCWTQANPDESGYTYASFDPVRRIDYVLGRNLPSGVLSASIIGGEPVDGIYPSDHMGIVVDLDL